MRLATISFLVLAVAILFSLALGPAPAQESLGSESDLKKAFYQSRDTFYKLLNNKLEPGPKDMAALDAVCKWYVYRTTLVTWVKKPEEMAKFMLEFERDFIGSISRNGKPGLVNAIGRTLKNRFQDVFNLDFKENRQSHIYAAVMLAVAARLKQEDFGDFLVEIVQNPKQKYHDAVRLYALKGLREYFPIRLVTDYDDPNDKKIQQRRQREKKRVQVLLDFLDRKWQVSDDKRYLDTVSFIRKEALATLAQVQWPVVYIDRKGTKVEGPAVYGLVKPFSKDGLQPPPSVAEKCEAALGLCQLKTSDIPDYQAEVSVYLVGKALLAMGGEYQKDLPNFAGKGKDEIKKPPRLPWKTYAERFLQGLTELQTNTKETTAHQSARQLSDSAREVLLGIKQYEEYSKINPKVQELEQTVEGLRPKTNQIFKKVKEQPQFDFSG